MATETDRHITTAEAATILGISQRQVLRLIKAGDLTVAGTFARTQVLSEAEVKTLADRRRASNSSKVA